MQKRIFLKKFFQGEFFLILTVLFFIVVPSMESTASTLSPSQISASQKKTLTSQIVNKTLIQTASPTKVIIPTINLNSTVLALGKNLDGNMAVPNGKTNNVGWYKDGTIPGNIGSAVFDAHLFAAFSNLKKLKVGDDIYVVNTQNQQLHFVVTSTKNYSLQTLTPDTLFGQDGTRKLNLITCAGKLTANKSTYDHRLIVSANYVDSIPLLKIAQNI